MVSVSVRVFVAATLCSYCAWAGPVPLYSRNATAGSQGVSQDVFDRLKRYSQFSAAAYCQSNVKKAVIDYGGSQLGERIECAAGTCPELENDDQVFRVSSIQGKGTTGVNGFVSLDRTKKSTVVTFQGSVGPLQWLTDGRFNQIVNATDVYNNMKDGTTTLDQFEGTQLCNDCMAHHGFLASWKQARQDVLDQTDWWIKNYPYHKVVLAGHSLGGAIAALAASEIKKRAQNANRVITVDLYSYGAPRLGNQKLIDFITNQGMGEIYIAKHYNDMIPRLPPTEKKWLPLPWSYADFPVEYYINTGNGKDQNVRPSDIIRYDHPTKYQGNRQFAIVNPFRGHWMYFQNVPKCMRS